MRKRGSKRKEKEGRRNGRDGGREEGRMGGRREGKEAKVGKTMMTKREKKSWRRKEGRGHPGKATR